MSILLTEVEARVVGSLVEKQLTTPEYYPMTLNALTNACNQKSNREPVVSYTEDVVTKAIESLRVKNVAYVFYGSTSRVPKYKHMLPEVYELDRKEVAIIAVLMLRGAQTLGELRERTSRLYEFSGLGEVNETLDGLMTRDTPLVIQLPRQQGQKETRFAHLLCGEIDLEALAETAAVSNRAGSNDRLAKLEQEVEALTAEMQNLRQMFEDFKKQFE
ncbi:MAG TPA: YceH family protein [Pyrinomonadaceae bacterium]|jgi:hypothetical protein|nr:YceH family protein [Pyrinomonadaceae bacterium]